MFECHVDIKENTHHLTLELFCRPWRPIEKAASRIIACCRRTYCVTVCDNRCRGTCDARASEKKDTENAFSVLYWWNIRKLSELNTITTKQATYSYPQKHV